MIKNTILIATSFIALLVFVVYHNSTNIIVTTSIKYIEPEYVADFSDDKILVGASHNIFIGKVVEQVGQKERGIGPETQFSVLVIDNIKGELKNTVIVDQQGGYENGVLYKVGSKDENKNIDPYFIQVGSTYLLATRYDKKENWYTLNSYPTASKFLDNGLSELNDYQLQIKAESDPRVKAIEAAYPNEKLLDADVKNNNTLNNYISTHLNSIKKY